jgi:hypothetical protein
MLLLLLWRHASYYSEGEHLENPQQLQASMLRMSRALATPDMEEFQEELRRKLAPVLHRLDIVRHHANLNITKMPHSDLDRTLSTSVTDGSPLESTLTSCGEG